MLAFFTLLIMLGVCYAFWREGLFTTCCMFINVVLAGLIAFFFFEPIADELDALVQGSFLSGYEDCFSLIFLFSLTLGLLRLATNSFAYTELDFPPGLLRGGCVVFGLLTGYLVAGFLLCAMQTLPLPEDFMGLEVRTNENQPKTLRRLLPPDRVWLAMMHRAGAGPL
ncbi:MAG: CvpA family protein, partial [Planctomycetes bacterium]|nr:CvpA family protein [Planctomycetota bacterium]